MNKHPSDKTPSSDFSMWASPIVEVSPSWTNPYVMQNKTMGFNTVLWHPIKCHQIFLLDRIYRCWQTRISNFMMIQGNSDPFRNMCFEVVLHKYIQYYLHSCVLVDFVRSIVNSRPSDRHPRLTPFLRTS